jgi:type III restriction enzyme
MLELRDYQKRSLEALEAYLGRAVQYGPKQAFLAQTDRPYVPVAQLPELPYVCLRVPTGGGKTLMACHALGITARAYLQRDRAVCLWLVPSNAIREQTLSALKDRQHPYRQALDASFSGQVRAVDLTEALYIQRGVLEGETVVIVSTLQALRVEDTEGRKVYESAGALQHHFTALASGLEATLEKREGGSPIYSLANVLRLWRPLVIMDEAHNARTQLSFETLARFSPSAIIEFTATPQSENKPERALFASNVLCHVSAAELKAEDMVKLPIQLRTRGDWREVIADTVETQRRLERAAQTEEKETGEYIRPLVLLQAQPKSQERQTLTVETVRQSLIDDFKIPAEQIAIATGQKWELDEVNLFERECAKRFIITVQALREGWDCSFAYILCSVAEIGSSRAVEQILGRILRLPNARRKRHPDLNCAYAFTASARFIDAATALKDGLVENGFERLEASDLVNPASQTDLPLQEGTLFAKTSVRISAPPDLASLDEELRRNLSYDQASHTLTLNGEISAVDLAAIQGSLAKPEDRAAVVNVLRERQGAGAGPFALTEQQRPPFKVPWLATRDGDQLEIFDDSYVQDIEWNLAECDPTLSEQEFPTVATPGEAGVIDVSETGKITLSFVDQLHEQFALLIPELGWTRESLVGWIDCQVRHVDITRAQSAPFIDYVVRDLMEKRGLTVEQLARQKYRLRNAIAVKIDQYRQAEHRKSYERLLFGPDSGKIDVSRKFCFEFEGGRYAPNWYYQGAYCFGKHYFSKLGELKPEGEEFECATFLDRNPRVRYWVRNIERSLYSFWLQTSTDKFYPDFVALLHDGRILVVESKGEPYWSNDDSKEKRLLGKLWADHSDGWSLFVMPKGTNWSEIESAMNAPSPLAIKDPGGLFQ